MVGEGMTGWLVLMASALSSYAGCRQYLENIEDARREAGPNSPEVLKLRVFYNHPGFLGPMASRVAAALEAIPDAALVFTAHSLPLAMASDCRYVEHLQEAGRLVALEVGREVGHERYDLVYQSRSGAPGQPWLEPDILDHLRALAARGVRDVVVAPIGYISDHMEVVYDLDVQARELAAHLGLNMVRAQTVGADEKFVSMIRDLVVERRADSGQ